MIGILTSSESNHRVSLPPETLAFRLNVHEVRGGLYTAVGLFCSDVGYGFIAGMALGLAHADAGIVAAFMASIIGTLVPFLLRASGPLYGCPRPAQTLIFAALVTSAAGEGDPSRVVMLCFLCGVLTGALQIAFALLGLGKLVRFMPVPVLAGFTNGVALSMMLSALMIIVGREGPVAHSLTEAMLPVRVLFVAVLLAVMIAVFRWQKRLHWSLVALVAGTGLYLFTVPLLPAGALGGTLPAVNSLIPWLGIASAAFSLAAIGPDELILVLVPALSLATLNSLESLVVTNHQEMSLGLRSDARRVLLGQGWANLLGGILGALPSSPSMSRQNVARQMGARNWASTLVFALAIFGVMLLTPLFVRHVPNLAVAALLFYLAWALVDPWTKVHLPELWRRLGQGRDYRRQMQTDMAIMAVVMLTAVVLDLISALLLGIVLAMALFVRHNSRSIVARVFSGQQRHSSVMRPPGQVTFLHAHGQQLALVELSGALFFGTGEILADEVERLGRRARWIILDFRQVSSIDVSGAGALLRLSNRLHQHQARLLLAGLDPNEQRGRVVLGAARKALPVEIWYPDVDLALEAAEDALLAASGAAIDPVGDRSRPEGLPELSDEQFNVRVGDV